MIVDSAVYVDGPGRGAGAVDEAPGIDPEARRYLRGVEDRVLKVTEQIEGFRELLSNILGVNLTMVSIRQNEQVQKIWSWSRASSTWASAAPAGFSEAVAARTDPLGRRRYHERRWRRAREVRA